MIDRIIKAILRCRLFALSIFLTYLLSSSVGIFMAHAGNRFAVMQRDKTVQNALISDESIHRLSIRATMPPRWFLISPVTCSMQQFPRPWLGSGSFCPTSPSRIRAGSGGLCLSTALTAAASEASRPQATLSSCCCSSSFHFRCPLVRGSGAALNSIDSMPMSVGASGSIGFRARVLSISAACLQ